MRNAALLRPDIEQGKLRCDIMLFFLEMTPDFVLDPEILKYAIAGKAANRELFEAFVVRLRAAGILKEAVDIAVQYVRSRTPIDVAIETYLLSIKP